MEAFLLATGLVALAEIGDKTQLLAFFLAAKFRRPIPIILGILVATLVNHAGAGMIGLWLSAWLSAEVLRWLLGLSFLAMALWMLIPDQLDEDEKLSRHGVFITTVILFFLAEMGDKTQLATIALAAKYQSVISIMTGTTLGMMLANVPAVLLGQRLTRNLPTRTLHGITALAFAILGVFTLLGLDRIFPFE